MCHFKGILVLLSIGRLPEVGGDGGDYMSGALVVYMWGALVIYLWGSLIGWHGDPI